MDWKKRRKYLKIPLWIVGIWAVLLVVLQIIMSPAMLTKITNRLVDEMVDAEVNFGEVRASVFRSFPHLDVGFSEFSVCYPSERFERIDSSFYSRQGWGESADTLVYMKEMHLSVNLAALLAKSVNIPSVMMDSPRIYAKNYGDAGTNWNVFSAFADETQEKADSTQFYEEVEPESKDSSFGKYRFVLGNIVLLKPRIVYSSPGDTLFAMADLRKLRYSGRLKSDKNIKSRHRNGLTLDSLFISGRLPSDTLALKLDKFGLQFRRKHIDLRAAATAFLASRDYGRVGVPIKFRANVGFPADSSKAISINQLQASVAQIPIKASVDLNFEQGLYLKGNASVDNCKINEVLKHFRRSVFKSLENFETDALLSLDANFEGYYNSSTGDIPDFELSLLIPPATISNKLFNAKHELALDARIQRTKEDGINLTLNDLHLKGKGLQLSANVLARDLLGLEPEVDTDLSVAVSLDTLSTFLKRKSGVDMAGSLEASLNGKLKLSEFSMYDLVQSDVEACIRSSRLSLATDSLRLYADNLDVYLASKHNSKATSKADERILTIEASLDSALFLMKDAMRVKGKDIKLSAWNSAAILNDKDSSKFYPFEGRLDMGSMSMMGVDTSLVALRNSGAEFSISRKSPDSQVPVLSLEGSSERIFVRGSVSRLSASGLNLNAKASMNSLERRRRPRPQGDTLSGAFLRRQMMRERSGEDELRAHNLKLDLSESTRKYLREWDFEGSFALQRASLASPYFPLRNSMNSVSASFNNNEISIAKLGIRSGSSSLNAKGKLSGLRGLAQGWGRINLNLDVNSDKLNINELLAAYMKGQDFVPKQESSDILDIEDEEYESSFIVEEFADTLVQSSPLIIVPGNLVADISLKASNVSYSSMNIESMSTDIAIRERCLQLTNTAASSDIGNIAFEGFYSTRSKEELKTGFDLQFQDVTAEKVIEMLPAVDSMVPMLKSFQGKLNCVLSATAELDTTMSVKIPTLNGILRISGEDLTLKDSELFTDIAKKLMFKDKNTGHIDHMSVEGYIADSNIEVFPFVLEVDRYTLAMSGMQNLDSNFQYHVSVINSPLPFRVGIDFTGSFDDVKFKIGKAKYKSADVPVFSSVIDETRLNLRESIKDIFNRGVERAMQESDRHERFDNFKKRIAYSSVVNAQLDSLSEAEKLQLSLVE